MSESLGNAEDVLISVFSNTAACGDGGAWVLTEEMAISLISLIWGVTWAAGALKLPRGFSYLQDREPLTMEQFVLHSFFLCSHPPFIHSSLTHGVYVSVKCQTRWYSESPFFPAVQIPL